MSNLVDRYRNLGHSVWCLRDLSIALPIGYLIVYLLGYAAYSTVALVTIMLISLGCACVAYYKNMQREQLKSWIMANKDLRKYITR
jgi:hypothetical protein